MKEYNEQVVETLDDAGCIIANKNIIIDNLQARIAELEEENARLHEQVDLQIPAIAFNQLTEQLAASQLRETQLREALGICLKEIESWCDEVGYERFNHPEVNKALAIPQDTTALEAIIAKAGEVMRERWLRSFDLSGLGNSEMIRPQDVVRAIRAFPGVTLEDLK